ncbi:hypothetical protein J4E91_001757 [Alternaria rosae]|nr:hypothetical protein J4E91_001757 [Alternaria rosae]
MTRYRVRLPELAKRRLLPANGNVGIRTGHRESSADTIKVVARNLDELELLLGHRCNHQTSQFLVQCRKSTELFFRDRLRSRRKEVHMG